MCCGEEYDDEHVKKLAASLLKEAHGDADRAIAHANYCHAVGGPTWRDYGDAAKLLLSGWRPK